MSFNQSGSNASATFGTYNDVSGNQTNTTIQGIVHVQNNNFTNQDPNVHTALIRDLKDKLNPSDFAGDDRPECLENTRKKTLNSIYQWVNTRGYPNVLLLSGAAGTGKSTIATTVAGEYQKRGQLGCHMFFVRGRSHPRTALQTIAYSLAVYNQSIAVSLVEKLRKSGDLNSSNLKTKFDILLRDPLSAVSTKVGHPVLIVLDALDECGTSELRRSLLDVLRARLSSLPANFRILITSRPEEDIASLNSERKFLTVTIDQHSDESKANVSTYIEFEFNQMRSSGKLNVPDDYEWDRNIRRLSESADGLFIWASTAVRFVREERLFQFRCFQNLVSNANSLKLDELYMTVLSHVSKWNEEDKTTLKNVFSLILFAKCPLSDTETDAILDMDKGTTSNLLSYFRSLVRYEGGQPITIYHASFYDYLISCEGEPWHVDPSVQRAYIASKCFERMKRLLKYNICNIPSSSVLNADVPDIDIRVTRYIPQFLKYICCNWIHHLQDVSYSQHLCFQLQSFVYNQLLFWFEVLSLTNTFNHHVGPALLFAIEWVGNHDPKLSSFLRDASRQASIYSKPISESVLHIYTSLLPLTKEESPMSIHYAEYADNAHRVEYIGKRQHNDCIKTIQVESGYVSMLSFSPDGTRILSNSFRGVYVLDATSGETIAGPLIVDGKKGDKGNEEEALSAAYLPDGRYIVVATTNGIILKWDVLTSCLVSERMMSDFQIASTWAATFSPDRKSFVFGDDEGIIRVWNVDTGEQDGGLLEGHTSSIRCLSFSSDGKYLVSGSSDGVIIIWGMDERRVKTSPLREHTRKVMAVSFSPCGTYIVSGSLDKTILVWDVSTGEVLRKIICGDQVYSVTYSPNGLFILAGGERLLSMWNVANDTAAPKEFQVDRRRDIMQVSFSPDGSRFASGCFDLIKIWDASWGVEETKASFEEGGAIRSISLSPGSKFIASGSSNGSICLWNLLTGELVKELKLSYDVDSVAFSPVNEQLIAFGSGSWDDGKVKVWDVTDDEPVTIGSHKASVRSVMFSPSDGKHVASGSSDNTICIWNVNRQRLAVGPLTGHEGAIFAVAYSPDGTRLVSGSWDKTVRIWNSETGDLLSTLNGHSYWIQSVAYSFDGSRIVSGSSDKRILVWDAQSGQIVCGPITGHDTWVDSVCFSPDGKQILSGSWDKTARVWDAITGNPLFPPFSGHTHSISSVCFFPNGRHFATGSLGGTIRIWTLDEILIDSGWELRHDNWVVGKNGRLMMWIPKDLHRYLYRPKNVSMLNHSFHLKLHFDTE